VSAAKSWLPPQPQARWVKQSTPVRWKQQYSYRSRWIASSRAQRPLSFLQWRARFSFRWLHLRRDRPKRGKDATDGMMPAPTLSLLVDNEYPGLDQTDLVFIDPVGTGYSRAFVTAIRPKVSCSGATWNPWANLPSLPRTFDKLVSRLSWWRKLRHRHNPRRGLQDYLFEPAASL